MKALTWHGKEDVRVDTVPDPRIEEPGRHRDPRDCDRNLRIRPAHLRWLRSADGSRGHPRPQFMAEVVEIGPEVTRFRKGDRVVVSFVIACGQCYFCERSLWSCCDTTNRDAHKLVDVARPGRSGLVRLLAPVRRIFGRSGGILARTLADFGPIKVESETCATTRCCSCPTSSRPAIWRRRTPTSRKATPSRSGAADR